MPLTAERALQILRQAPKARRPDYIPWEQKNIWGRVGSVLQRGTYATAGLTKELIQPGARFEPGREIWKGITGQEEETFKEVFDIMGWHPTSVPGRLMKGGVALAADIFLDPLTYFTFGGFTKLGRLAKVAKIPRTMKLARLARAQELRLLRRLTPGMKGLRGIPKGRGALALTAAMRAKKGQIAAIKYMGIPIVRGEQLYYWGGKLGKKIPGLPFIGPAVKAARKLFITGYKGPYKHLGLVKKATENSQQYMRRMETDYGIEVMRAISKASKKLKLAPEQVMDQVVTVMELSPTRIRELRKWGKTTQSPEIKSIFNTEIKRITGELRRHFPKGVKVPREINILKDALESKFARHLELEKELNLSAELGKRFYKHSPKMLKSIEEAILTGRISPDEARLMLDVPTELLGFMSKWRRGVYKTPQARKFVKDRISYLLRATTPEYFPRVISPDQARQYLRQALGSPKMWNPRLRNALARRTADFTLEEWNEFAKVNGLSNLGGRTVESFFTKNPAYAAAVRGVRSWNAISSYKFLEEVGGKFGKTAEQLGGETALKGFIQRGWDQMPEKWQKLIPNLRGKWFDPVVAHEMSRYYSFTTNPEHIGDFIRLFDVTQNWWKAHVLTYFPGYHSRNIVGNVMNNILAGVKNIFRYNDALELQVWDKTLSRADLLKKTVTIKGKVYNAWDILKEAKRTGVLGRGWMGFDIPTTIADDFAKATWNPFSRHFWLVKQGRNVGMYAENNARLAHFLDRIGKGWSAEEAASSVKQFLFDYGDLTDFERMTMKRFFPFYTWTRKNIPLQVENALKQPGKYTPILKAAEKTVIGGERVPEAERRVMPEWLKKRAPVRMGIGRAKGRPRYFPLESFLPQADIMKLKRPIELPFELLSPIIREPLELAFNKSFYFDDKINRYVGQRRELLGVDVPTRVEYVLRSLRIVNELDRLFGARARDLTKFERGFRAMTNVRFYPLDVVKYRKIFDWQINKEIAELKRGYTMAVKNKRYGNARRILGLLRTVKARKQLNAPKAVERGY